MVNQSFRHIRFDWAVKKLLRSKANFGILEGFLSELFKEDVFIEALLESEGNREYPEDKSNRVDLLVKDSQGRLIIVEIQNTRELDYFYKIVYNTAKATTEYIHVSEPYKNIKKVISVSIVYFDLGQGEDYVYHGRTEFVGIHSRDRLALSEKQKRMFEKDSISRIFPEHYIIKVNEFNDVAKDTLDEWVYFLKNSEILDEFKAKGLGEAREKLREMNLTEEARREYLSYLEMMREHASIEATIEGERRIDIEDARAEGFEKGRVEGLLSAARLMRDQGMDLESIARLLKISLEELRLGL